MAGQSVYLGSNEVTEIYLGDTKIEEAYLGTELVYSSGPFEGLKMSPKSFIFTQSTLSGSLKIKSSEPWTLTLPAWITADALTGDTGETIVSLTATAQSAATSGTIVAASTNYSASTTAEYTMANFIDYIHSQNMGNNNQNYLYTSIYPDLTTRGELIFKHRGYTTGNILVGMFGTESGWDSRDWRLFTYSSKYNMDMGADRIADALDGFTSGNDYSISFGNNYIINNTNGRSVTGPTKSPTLDHLPIRICLGVVYVKEVKLWQGETLVFDGKAAEQNGQYGLFDLVSGTLLTTNDFVIEGGLIV